MPTTPEIVQCDPDVAAAAPALVVWHPAPGIIESLTLEAIARREKPIANQPLERA